MKRRHLLLSLIALAQPVAAQTAGELHLRRLLSVPIGALPPAAMLMPASRNHNYWVGRVQGGSQWDNLVGDLATTAVGVDLQWRGGSSFGLTVGQQWADCEQPVGNCDAHAMIGGRARFNVVTGGPTVAAIVGDNSATTTVGAEIGLGYAPNDIAGRNACALDVGAPVSVSLFQRMRVLTFLTPGIAWDMPCIVSGNHTAGASTFLGAGIGLQQLGSRGLDVSIGIQRIFRRRAGVQLGINVTYVRLP
ncbi:MAG TPA: hypothetical protein VIP11_20650 [Gemmatimonadaceae bacterium]